MTERPPTKTASISEQRLLALSATGLLDTPPERELDTIANLARSALHCRIALITLVDEHRQWFKARCGLDRSETPIEHSFCAHAVDADALLVVPDASIDPRYATNPLVTGAPFIRFYAGVPIHVPSPDGSGRPVAIGTLCVIDDKPKTLSAQDHLILADLAHLVEALIQVSQMAARSVRLAEDSKRHVQALRREQQQFRQAERLANIGSWRLTLQGGAVEWSSQVFAIHGLPVGETPPLERALDYYPPHARTIVADAVSKSLASGEPFDVETDFVAADGVVKRVRSIGEVETVDGEPVAIIGVVQDVTVQYRLEQRLRRSAHIDALTQIANRAGCNEALDASIAAARRDDTALTLLLIDLDGFKTVNDRCGHLAGDELLQTVAMRLKAASPPGSFVGRLGGDEFVVIDALAKRSPDESRVEEMLAALRVSVPAPDGEIRVSGTIGISRLDKTIQNRSDLLRRADLALYHAKRTMPGSAVAYTPVDPGAPTLAALAARLSAVAQHPAEYSPEFTVVSPPVPPDRDGAPRRPDARVSSSAR